MSTAQTIGQQGRRARILLVDDDQDHVDLTRMALEEARLLLDLHVVRDGLECMAFLRGEGAHAGAPRPDLLLLDINMPRMNGYQVMQAILDDEGLRSLPVVVLSTSADLLDVQRMHALRCNSYLIKPVRFDEFVRMLTQVGKYWLELVVLPG